MSLLLDALQRASKDKEKAASAAATASAPHATPAPHAAPEPELSLTPTDAKGARDENAAQDVPLPVLVHEVIAPTARAIPVSVTPASGVPMHKRPPEPELSLAPQLPQELTLDLGDAPAVTPHAQPTPAAPIAPAPAPVATSSTPTHSAPELAPAPASIPEPAPEPVSMAPAPPSLSFTTANTSRVAQDMRRAYASTSAPTAQRRRRMLLVVGLVIALAVVVAGLALKFLEDRTASIAGVQATSAAAPAPVPASADPAPTTSATPADTAPAAQVEAAQVSAPVPPDIERPLKPQPKEPPARVASSLAVASAPATSTPPAPVANTTKTASAPSAPNPASTATASTSITEKSNDVLVQGGPGKQAFSVKTRGPSSLEEGYAALVAGRLEDAAQAYGQALKANSEERDALLGLAYIAQKRGQREEAQALYRRVLRQEPSNAIASAALLGLDADNDGSQTASRAKDLAMRQPDSAATMAMAGNAAVREGLLADAVQLFARAQFLEPANPLHAYNHAVALDRLGQFAAAAVQYEKVLKLSDPTASPSGRGYSPDAVKERLAQLRQALGTPAQAVK